MDSREEETIDSNASPVHVLQSPSAGHEHATPRRSSSRRRARASSIHANNALEDIQEPESEAEPLQAGRLSTTFDYPEVFPESEVTPVRAEMNAFHMQFGEVRFQLSRLSTLRKDVNESLHKLQQQINKMTVKYAENNDVTQKLKRELHVFTNELTALKNYFSVESRSTDQALFQEIEREKAKNAILTLLVEKKGLKEQYKHALLKDQAELEKRVRTNEDALHKAVQHYIGLQVAVNTQANFANGLGIQMQNALTQLNEIMRQSRNIIDDQAPRNWVSWWKDINQTPAKRYALKSLEKFAKHPVLKLSNERDKELEKHLKIVQDLTQALFFMMHYSSVTLNEPKNDGLESEEDVEVSFDDSHIQGDTVDTSFLSLKSIPDEMNETDSQQAINIAVMAYIQDILSGIPSMKGGRLGYEKTGLQNWGLVFKALGAALLLGISALAIASFVGYTAPAAFVMSYVTAAKSIAMVSAVLEFVASKLSLDFTAATVVTAASTSTALVGMGMFATYMGGPTSFKRNAIEVADNIKKVIDSPKFGG